MSSVGSRVADSPDPKSEVHALTVEELVLFLRTASQEDASTYCEELVRRFNPLLRQVWRNWVPKVEYGDFLHDVLVRLFQGLPALLNPKAFPGYFRKVVLSVAADLARKRLSTAAGIAQEVSLEEVARVVGQIDEDILPRIFVRSYLEYLPPRERQVLALELFEDQSTVDIATALGITPGAVRTTKSRAINRLRNLLLKEAKALEESPSEG